MRHAPARPSKAMVKIPRLEHRRIEALAVEADERPARFKLARQPTEAAAARRRCRTSRYCRVRIPPSSSNHAAADQKRVRAGPAAQTRLFRDRRRRSGATHGRAGRGTAAVSRRSDRGAKCPRVPRRADARGRVSSSTTDSRRHRQSHATGAPSMRHRTLGSGSNQDVGHGDPPRRRSPSGSSAVAVSAGLQDAARGDRRALTRQSFGSTPSRSVALIGRRVRGRVNRFENLQRRGLRERPGFAHRPDATGTSVLAAALGDQTPRAGQQLVVHAEQRLAETDAAGIVVVDEHARLLSAASSERRSAAAPVAGVDRDADVVPVAHQQQLRHLPHGEGQARRCRRADRRPRTAAAPSPRPESSASTTWCASAARADRARRSRRSRSCRT